MNNKIFYIIIIILVLIVISSGAYFILKTGIKNKVKTPTPIDFSQNIINQNIQNQEIINSAQNKTAKQNNPIDFSCPKQGDDITLTSISGKVIFPKGIKNPSDFGISAGDSSIQKMIHPDGYFCAMYFYPKNMPSLIQVVSNNSTDFRLSTFVNPINNSDGIIIDSQSTAVVFTLFNSGGYTKSDSIIENDPKVKEFSSAINNADVLDSGSIKPGGNLYDYLQAAVNSIK